MSVAQSQLRCRLPDGQIAAAAVLLKVHHCLAHIAALGAGLHAGKRLWLRCGLCGDALLQRQNGVFQIAVMKRLQQKVHRAQTDGRLRVGERIVVKCEKRQRQNYNKNKIKQDSLKIQFR